MPHIFISYSRVDKAFTERFVTRLRRMFRNYKVWYDAELHGGDQWWDAILAQVEACDLFIYLLSNESVTSPYCQAEFAEAQRLQKRIITVQVRDRTKLTGNLGDIRYVDMKAGIDDAEPQAALVDAINHQITKLPKRRPKPLAPERTPRPPTTEEKPRSAADPDVDTPTLHLTDKGELALAKTPPKGNNRPTLLAGAAVILIVIVLGIVAFSNPNLFAPANTSTPTPTATEAAVAQAATNTLPPTETASPTLEPTTTPTPSITLSPIPTLSGTEIEKTVQAQMKGIQTEAAQTIAANLTATAAIATAYAQMTLYAQATHAANLTATATLWTSLPTPDTRLTAETRLTQTQAALIAQATQNAAASATGAMLDQTATATLWTDTPTPTLTPSRTPTPTPTLSDIQIASTPAAVNADWTPIEQDFDGVTMVMVPAGCFDMGSDNGVSDEKPVTEICFTAPFWLDKTEVTNGQFAQFDGEAANASRWPDADRPRENITWFEARDFCAQREARLPTEAEWEYAARGPENWVYPWGNEFVANNVVFGDNSGSQTAAAGSKPGGASWVGALDLSGNVWEWASSAYQPYPYQADDGREDSNGTDVQRVLRGGSWFNVYPSNFRAASRSRDTTDHRNNIRGFRCVRLS